ncbi:sensor histidine kinase [bacterium]|nr:sensor histidine kinase [bacterium]
MIFSDLPSQFEDKKKMILFLAAVLIIGFLATSIISYLVSRNSIRQSILKNELPLASDNIYSEIQRDLLKPIFISSLMANDTFFRDWIINGENDISEIRKYLTEIKSEYNTITSFFVSERSRKYYYPDGILKTISENETRDEWYFRVRSMKTSYEVNVDPDMANRDTMTIFINFRVLDYQGNFIGATGIGLTVDMVKKLINTYRARYNRDIYFFNEAGALILHSKNMKLVSPGDFRINDIPGLRDFSISLKENNRDKYNAQQVSENSLLNVRYIPDLKWYLVIEQAEDHTVDLLRKTLLINLSICFIICFVTLGIIRFTIIRYQERLEKRNIELAEKNQKIDEQRAQLEKQTFQLEKANHELKILNHEKDDFVGITAHDLKSPLNAVIGFAELIQHGEKTDDENRKYATYIVESSLNIVERINNLLDVDEAESGYEVKLQPFDFRTSVERTVQDFKFQAQTKNIVLKTTIPDQPVMTLANEKWMVEIIGNLVSNAIKYSPKHKTVELNLATQDERVTLEVADQGPGLTSSELSKLFEKYTLASPKPTAGESSTGLGLYIVKKMTQRMGGSVWCDSIPGEGSRFFVGFPAAR